MDHRAVVRMLSTGRIALGAALLVAPGLAARTWVGAGAEATEAKVLARAVGARDVALGLGTHQALRSGAPVRPWALAGALSDGVDLAATVLALRTLGLRRTLPILAMAGGATALALAGADHVDP